MTTEDGRRDDETVATASRRVRPWGALAYPQYRLLIGTLTFGMLGMQMRQVTNLWVIHELTGSTLHVGLLGVFQFVPLVLFGFLGGSLADIMDRKKLLIIAQAGNLAMAAMLAAIALAGVLEVWHIYLATLITTSTSMFDQPARMGLTYALVSRSHLMNAITLNSSSRHTAMLVGPMLGATVIGWQGVGMAYALNAAMLVPATLGLAFVRVHANAQPRRFRNAMSPREMFAGIKFFWSTQIILALVLMDIVATIFGAHRVVMPTFADDILQVGELGFGMLMSAPAAGFLAGSAVLLLLGDMRRKGLLVLGTFAGYAGAIALFAISRSFALSLVAIALVGALDGIGGITRQTTLQLLVPEEIRGRATGALHIFTRGAPSLGYVVTGFLAAGLGAPNALLLGSAISLSVAFLILVAWRQVRAFRG